MLILCSGIDAAAWVPMHHVCGRCRAYFLPFWADFLKYRYDVNDDRRFHLGTPRQVFSSLKRCWEIAPSSDRIVEDIMNFVPVLRKLVEHGGHRRSSG